MIHAGHLFTATALLAQAAGGSASGSAAAQGTSQLLIWAIILFGMAIAFFFAGERNGACPVFILIRHLLFLGLNNEDKII